MDNKKKLATLVTQDKAKKTKIYNTICVGHHHAQDGKKQKTQHNMSWTPLYANMLSCR
jgi:outer membrane phospholipase A